MSLPNFDRRRELTTDDLVRLDEPKVIYEGQHVDSDGVIAWVFTVGGVLEGRPVETPNHARREVEGCTVAGDTIMVHAVDKNEAFLLAAAGLETTINALRTGGPKQSALAIDAAYRPKRSLH